jgi:hypothetical protein
MKDRGTNPFSRLWKEIRCAMCGTEIEVIPQVFDKALAKNKDYFIVYCWNCNRETRVSLKNMGDGDT